MNDIRRFSAYVSTFYHSEYITLVTNKRIHIFIIHIYQCMNKVMVRLVGPIQNGVYAVTHALTL